MPMRRSPPRGQAHVGLTIHISVGWLLPRRVFIKPLLDDFLPQQDEADDTRQALIDQALVSQAQPSDAQVLPSCSQVKSHQKASSAFQKAWHAYCDAHGGGVYDPARPGEMCSSPVRGEPLLNRHKVQLLEQFLKTAASKHAGLHRRVACWTSLH